MVSFALVLTAVTASAQVTAIRLNTPALTAPAAMSGAVADRALPAAPALSAAPWMAAASVPVPVAPAPLAAAAPALAPAAPVAHALSAAAGRLSAAEKAPAGHADPRGLSGTVFDGSSWRAAADGPQPVPAGDASAAQLSALNASVAEILRPYNNQLSRASLTFSRIATNETRATEVALTLDFAKKGANGDASVKVENLSYSYPNAATATPETRAKGSIGVNLLNLMTQKQINDLGPQAQKTVERFIADKITQYGPAATVSAAVTHQATDAQGNLTALSLALNLDVDLSKLPANTDAKSVLATGLHATVDITLKGLDFSITVVSNPNASQFSRDQVGLKEMLDKLLAGEPQTVARLGDLFRTLDQLAAYATSGPRR